ncbi:hypothetical protein [Actinocorallia longicatena]|uniref:hypothetical protein n=1 Tax=Actinocorallia longicatena TaxID=111803 RepID=UPI0031D32375
MTVSTTYNFEVTDSPHSVLGNNNLIQWILNVPRAVWVLVSAVLTGILATGFGALYFGWFAPEFAPNYRTMFLVDASETTDSQGLSALTESLKKTMGNSGDEDFIGLRALGGECGVSANTRRLVPFGTGNRQQITDAAGRMSPSGKPTLVRGIVEAVADFSKPLHQKARQVDRIIVVARHGIDACDDDAAFVENEIRQRVSAAGLSLEFRFVGYKVPKIQRAGLERMAEAVKAPAPFHADTQADLDRALDHFANAEPILTGAQHMVDEFNTATGQVEQAVQEMVDGRPDIAAKTLGRAEKTAGGTGDLLDELAARARSPYGRDIKQRAEALRGRQERVLAAATDLLGAARAGSPLERGLAVFQQAADAYNTERTSMNRALSRLRGGLAGSS